MTVPTNAFQTYAAKGNREDLIDIIVNISPTKTPVLSMTESVRAFATLHEWQTDSLNSPTANAARITALQKPSGVRPSVSIRL